MSSGFWALLGAGIFLVILFYILKPLQVSIQPSTIAPSPAPLPILTPTFTPTPTSILLISPAPTPTTNPLIIPLITPTPTPQVNNFSLRDLILLMELFQNRETPRPQQIIVVEPSPRSIPLQQIPVEQLVLSNILNGPGFSLRYPSNWTVIACNNSSNFEFDPFSNNPQQTQITCDVALAPITVLVQSNLSSCTGNIIVINNTRVVKSITQSGNRTTFQWCTITNPVLNITHRVSPTPGRAESNIDFSPVIEEIIFTLQTSS